MHFFQIFILLTMIFISTLVASIEGDILSVKRPMIYNNSTTKSLIIREGRSVKLECFAGGDPVPMVWWRRKGLIYNDNIFNIVAAKKKRDQGIYTCVAQNNFGESISHRVSVKVEFAPVITVPCSDVVQALHYEINLKCVIDAYPSPFVIWMKDGVQIISDDSVYSITQSFTANGLTCSTLKVTLLKIEQFGKYICQANNYIGSSEGAVYLSKPKHV